MSRRVIDAASKANTTSPTIDTAFLQVIEAMETEKFHIWNSVDLLDLYILLGGDKLLRRQLMENVTNHFGMEPIKLSGNGYASLLVFRGHAPNLLRTVDDAEKENPEMKHIVKRIVGETKQLKKSDKTYATRISKNIAEEAVSSPWPTF